MIPEDEALREAFRTEAGEILSGLETCLLDLENNPADREAVSSIFRAFHTLKGSGGLCGFDDVSGFTHHVETIYDFVRSGSIGVDKTLIDLTLSACDLIRIMIDPGQSGQEETDNREHELLSSFRNLLPQEMAHYFLTNAATGRKVVLGPELAGQQKRYRIRFRPSAGIFLSGTNPLLLLQELRSLGECSIAAGTGRVPPLQDIDAEACYTEWHVLLSTDQGLDRIKDVFIFVEGDGDLSIEVVDTEGPSRTEDPGDLRLPGDMTTGADFLSAVPASSARGTGPEKLNKGPMSSIRVSSQKIDNLVNLVGEMVTVQARLSRASFLRSDPELLSIAEEVERLTGDLRNSAMDIRMMPVGTIFSTFNRLVRDLSHELGKEVELITEGGETGIDKTVIERLNDPLVHLIRNSVDHGIEPPMAREAAGKPRKGTICLSAAHSGDKVIIRITDDGAGLDREAIIKKALGNGLIAPEKTLTEREIFSLILAPGFSTAGKITNISGRGVGMDVVKKAIESLRGSIRIESPEGSGTTITLALPLTLAIIEGLLVRVGEEYFVLPLSEVEECVELIGRGGYSQTGMNMANVRGRIVPYISLRGHFIVSGKAPEREQIVIVRKDEERIGLVVDQVIGGHQAVIKTLGKVYRNVPGVSGATILGDGTVALIVDIAAVVDSAEREEVDSTAGFTGEDFSNRNTENRFF